MVGRSAVRDRVEATLLDTGLDRLRVFTVTGQDWDSITQGLAEEHDDKVVVNMGPQHPSTHGVLRLILELSGETVTEARAGIGYLHTGIEKNMEFRSWTQGVTFCTRMDYLSPFYNEMTYVLGVERLLDIEEQVPEKAQVMRVLLMELNRISSHLVAIATGGMEIGALTVMTIGFRDWREAAEPYRARLERFLAATVLPGLGEAVISSRRFSMRSCALSGSSVLR